MKRIIMGKHTVQEVAKRSPERFLKIYSSRKEGKWPLPVQVVSKHQLDHLAGSSSHQGVVAEVKERDFLSPKAFLDNAPEKSTVLMCDAIQDPQNFGTILRAAECFGVDGVIYSKNRNVGLTPVVSKASVGASEIVPLIPVANLADTLKKFQDEGYFAVAAEVHPKAEPLSSFTFPERTLLIMGAEGKGIQPLLSKKADCHVMIPMSGALDSLNVSQATAVILSRIAPSA